MTDTGGEPRIWYTRRPIDAVERYKSCYQHHVGSPQPLDHRKGGPPPQSSEHLASPSDGYAICAGRMTNSLTAWTRAVTASKGHPHALLEFPLIARRRETHPLNISAPQRFACRFVGGGGGGKKKKKKKKKRGGGGGGGGGGPPHPPPPPPPPLCKSSSLSVIARPPRPPKRQVTDHSHHRGRPRIPALRHHEQAQGFCSAFPTHSRLSPISAGASRCRLNLGPAYAAATSFQRLLFATCPSGTGTGTILKPARKIASSLNVIVPEWPVAKPLPVMFWIRGGGNEGGISLEGALYGQRPPCQPRRHSRRRQLPPRHVGLPCRSGTHGRIRPSRFHNL